jgi:hypothetical protein
MVEFITFLATYWWLVILLMAAGAGLGIEIFKFLQLPPEEKKKKIGSFLLGLMIKAEDKLQSAEGQARFEVVLQEFYALCPGWMKDVLSYEDLRSFAQNIFKQNKDTIESVNQIKKTKVLASIGEDVPP